MYSYPPSDDDIREILLNAPVVEWPTFEHMPLNCFDIGNASLLFPGDISKSRQLEAGFFSPYRFDMSDPTTSRKRDEDFDLELWNEESHSIPWFLGRLTWKTMIDVESFVLTQGYFANLVAVLKFRHLQPNTNVQNIETLKDMVMLELSNMRHFDSLRREDLIVKEIHNQSWLIARQIDALKTPIYACYKAINTDSVIYVASGIEQAWIGDDLIPESVEQKYLASFWDFLSQIQIRFDKDLPPGTVAREAPGQAEKEDDLPQW